MMIRSLIGSKDHQPTPSYSMKRLTPPLCRKLSTTGTRPTSRTTKLREIGRDPFLIAYGMARPDRCVVTSEPSSPKKQRKNRRIPDVCNTFGITLLRRSVLCVQDTRVPHGKS